MDHKLDQSRQTRFGEPAAAAIFHNPPAGGAVVEGWFVMIIALLAVLGVDLIVVVVFLAVVLSRRRWVSHQMGAFAGIAHLTAGEVHAMGKKGRRGYGRWVRDVFVWTPGPLCLRNALIPVDSINQESAASGKVRRLGDHPSIVTLSAGTARIQVTVAADDIALVKAPFATSATKPVAAVVSDPVAAVRT